MSGDHQDIFDSEVPSGPQTTEGVSPEAPAGPPRDEAGRFAPKDKGEEAAEAVEGAPPAPAEKVRDIPISALLDERDKRQRLEAEIAMLRRQMAAQQPRPELPDPTTDAEGYTRAVTSTFEQRLMASKLEQSMFFAERDPAIGKDLVAEAMAYFDSQPRTVSEQFLHHPSPIHAACEWYKAQKSAAERSSPDYEAKLRAKLRAEWEAEQAQVSQSPARIPRSLAAAGGSGREPPPATNGDPLFS